MTMKLNIPEREITLVCPNCDSPLLSKDENEIITCETCDLQLHKDELIEQNNINIVEKIDVNQIAEDLAKEMRKYLKVMGGNK